MGLKFESNDDLEKLFDSFAVDPTKVELPKEEQDNETKNENDQDKQK